MKLNIAVIGIIFTIFSGIALTERSNAQETLSIEVFYQELSPYGGWSPHVEFGDVWQPYEVGPDWKPYTDGRWEWSDQGWIWISYEPWGWATYHYGRWIYDDYQGWLWIPGTIWAPAWVSWQQSPEYIGWSPLPPDRGFFIEIGFVFNSYNNYYYKPYGHNYHHKKHRYYHDYYNNPYHYKPPAAHCVFLPYNKFGHHKHAGKAALPPPHYDVVLRNSRNVTNIKRVNNKVINYGPDKHFIETHSNSKLVTHHIVDRNNVTLRGNKNINIVKDGTYSVYRPKIERTSRDSFTTNRNQINNKGSTRKGSTKNDSTRNNTNNSLSHKQTQLNRPSSKTNVNSNYKNQTRISEPSIKTGFSQNKDIRGNSTVTNKKIYNQNQQKNNNQNRVNTTPDGYNKYSYKNRQPANSRYVQPAANQKTQSIKGNKVSNNKGASNNTLNLGHKSTQRSNIENTSQYQKKTGSYNRVNQVSTKKSGNTNYSSKQKQASSKKSNVSQSSSYKPNVNTMPSQENPAFSRR